MTRRRHSSNPARRRRRDEGSAPLPPRAGVRASPLWQGSLHDIYDMVLAFKFCFRLPDDGREGDRALYSECQQTFKSSSNRRSVNAAGTPAPARGRPRRTVTRWTDSGGCHWSESAMSRINTSLAGSGVTVGPAETFLCCKIP